MVWICSTMTVICTRLVLSHPPMTMSRARPRSPHRMKVISHFDKRNETHAIIYGYRLNFNFKSNISRARQAAAAAAIRWWWLIASNRCKSIPKQIHHFIAKLSLDWYRQSSHFMSLLQCNFVVVMTAWSLAATAPSPESEIYIHNWLIQYQLFIVERSDREKQTKCALKCCSTSEGSLYFCCSHHHQIRSGEWRPPENIFIGRMSEVIALSCMRSCAETFNHRVN